MPQNTLNTSSLNLTSLSNVGGNFTAKWNGKTSLQPIGMVTGLVTLQYSNDNINFFDLSGFVAIDVNTPIVLDSADWAFYRFKVDTIGTGTVKWSVAGSEIPNTVINVSGSGGGGGVSTFNTRTGFVWAETGDYTTDQVTETLTKVFITPSEKTAITHSNRSVLDLITESFTTALKIAYDSTVTWISTNGATILSHLSNTSNPHSVTKTQVGLSDVDNTSDINKPVSIATQTEIDATNTAFNDFVTVDYINDLNSKQDSLVSGTNIKTIEGFSILGPGNLPILDRYNVYFFNDLISATALQPLIGSAISTGKFVQNTTNFSANSFGVCRTTKSTTANSGYRVMSDVNAIRIKGGEIYRQRFCPLLFTTATRRMGFHDATTVTDAVDGVYAEYSLSGNLVLKTSNNSTRTSSSVITTLSLNTWYTIEIIVNATATSVLLNLYNATGTLIATSSAITTNIPTGVGRECGIGFITTGSSATADALVDDDFFEFKQQLNR